MVKGACWMLVGVTWAACRAAELPTFDDFREADRERRTTGQLYTARSLALARIDSNLIARAAADHPDDAEILLGAAELGGDWDAALRVNRTNAVVSLRCALAGRSRWLAHCRAHDPENLVPWLTDPRAAAPTATRFDDHEVASARARIRCLEAAGYPAYAARRLSLLAEKPAVALARSKVTRETAQFWLRVGRAMQAAPTFLVTELVGQSIEVAALEATAKDGLRGEAADRVTDLSNRRERLQVLLQQAERAVDLATEAELVRYFDVVVREGEERAMQQLIRSTRRPPAVD